MDLNWNTVWTMLWFAINVILTTFIIVCFSVCYVPRWKRMYARFFFKAEKKFWQNTRFLVEYLLKRRIITFRSMRKKDIEKATEVWKGSFPKIGYDVCVLNLNSNLNTGNIYRSACCFGADKFVIFGKKVYNTSSTAGYKYISEEYFDVFPKLRDRLDKSTLEVFNEEMVSDVITKGKYLPVIIEQGKNSIWECDMKRLERLEDKKLLFIFGNESWGVPEKMIKLLVKKHSGIILTIPQIGGGHSLNVSNAASIVMYEYYRQLRSKVII